MHLFYRKKTMKLAVKAGLHTIICDGVHGFHPSELGRKAQLYGLHAVCGDAQAKPFAYAVTTNKLPRISRSFKTSLLALKSTVLTSTSSTSSSTTRLLLTMQQNSSVIFDRLKNENLILKVFNKDKVVGCMFHFGMSIARNVHFKGLSQFMEGRSRNSDISRWVEQLRALPFLPPALINKVDALKALPVRHNHLAYSKCKAFLEYFKTYWMPMEMRYKWNKWLVLTDRTTNMAESWHRALTDSIRCQHPSYHVLLQKLMDEEEACNNFLYNRVKVIPRIHRVFF
ncbi:hypothetical protein WR25_14789 isoform B [Diploscapter pachys]|uniref:MULE transposase domain-containing protein n=1 Tax=Diploscapter pachys TaxID=2018661 RepID=A0A2A2LYA4_9BILA|nr:hypothetical protein WR25_14789 isoform A [Diploscapter pachys]PAV91169.1 hypothetical protein WR25_14789 isoform B [Diploscapter pachys]